MASPTRFTKIGAASQKAKIDLNGNERNRGDYYRQTIAVVLKVVASGAAQDTGIIVPKGAAVSVLLNITTAEATGVTKTIDVGLSGGTGAEFGNDLSVAATGVVLGLSAPLVSGNTVTYTLGSADYVELDAELVIEIIGSDE